MKSVETPLTFLILADIHFGTLADAPEFRIAPSGIRHSTTRESRRDGLVSTVKGLTKKPDAIFVPGDLTSIASPGEFKGCVELILGIADELAIPRKHVFFTFGNHDTNWRVCELSAEAKDCPADKTYEHVAANIGSLYAPITNRIESGPVSGSGVFKINENRVFILNSGLFCVAEQTYRHGLLGKEQFEWLEEALKKHAANDGWKLLMVHHHPFNYTYPTPVEDVSCLQEGAELVELAGRAGIDLIFHGHRHHPRLFTQMQTGWTHPMTFFCGGSVAVVAHHRDGGRIPNLFHVVSLERRLKNKAALGEVTSFQFTTDGWKPTAYCSATPLDPVHWFGTVISESEMDEATNSFLQSLLDKTPVGNVECPRREELPTELKCCPLHELHTLLLKHAPRHKVKVIGKYPDAVALIR